MSDVYTDHEGKKLAGPCSLSEALELSEPCSSGLKLAVSVPDGDYVAMQMPNQLGGKVWVRRLNTVSGRAGSQMETGAWLDPKKKGTFVPTQWRPG